MIPRLVAKLVVSVEVDTALIDWPFETYVSWISLIRKFTVDPVPSPKTLFGSINLIDFEAAIFLPEMILSLHFLRNQLTSNYK